MILTILSIGVIIVLYALALSAHEQSIERTHGNSKDSGFNPNRKD